MPERSVVTFSGGTHRVSLSAILACRFCVLESLWVFDPLRARIPPHKLGLLWFGTPGNPNVGKNQDDVIQKKAVTTRADVLGTVVARKQSGWE
jgi:hypothetical protein